MKKEYDYIIVGAGLFGSTLARILTDNNKHCLVVEKRECVAGNINDYNLEGINVHKYGPHIFHTSDKEILDFVQRFCTLNNFINSPLACYDGVLYNLPFNMNTFSKMWGINTPDEAKNIINEQKSKYNFSTPKNLEEMAISLVGSDIYLKLVKGYTEKQWGTSALNLSPSIIKRLPVRFTFDNNYFNDLYQGIPINGYTDMINNMLSGIDVRLNCDYLLNKNEFESIGETIIYTGCIDEYYDYKFGALEYRSLEFETSILDTPNYQGVAVINYTNREIPYTRIIEHKHFNFKNQEKTVITKEYSVKWDLTKLPYYPVNNEVNDSIYQKYIELSKTNKNIHFGGRLGLYQYLDMDKVIKKAIDLSKELLKS